jgi:hypothetical protein
MPKAPRKGRERGNRKEDRNLYPEKNAGVPSANFYFLYSTYSIPFFSIYFKTLIDRCAGKCRFLLLNNGKKELQNEK